MQVDGVKVIHVTTIDMSLRFLLLNQLQDLARHGYDVVGVSAVGPDVAALEAAGIRHVPVQMTRRITPLADLRALVRLVWVFRDEKPEIVHTHTPKAAVLGRVAALLAATEVIFDTVHGFYFHDGTRPWVRRILVAVERYLGRRSDLVFFVSKEDLETAIRERICRPEQTRFLGNGIDLGRFDPAAVPPGAGASLRHELGIPESSPVVGFVGRLVAEKGIADLIRAAPAVVAAHPGVRFLLVGPDEPARADAFDRNTVPPDIAERCVWTGVRHDMPEIYSVMDVCVLPSYREGLPRSMMEASAMRVPCVGYDVRGTREAVLDGRNGLLVPVGDVSLLASEIARVLDDSGGAARMGEEGRSIACEAFDERRILRSVLDAYDEVLRQKQVVTQ